MRFIHYYLFVIFWGLLLNVNATLSASEDLTELDKQADKTPSKTSTHREHFFSIPQKAPELQQCIETCLYENQRVAMGFQVIEQQCRDNCQLSKKVQLLIIDLKKDIKERTGAWSWIIPELGALKNKDAVPVLIETLTKMDEDWLGREMSAKALGDIADPIAIPYLLAAAWRADTRDAAIEALTKFQDKRSIPIFMSALEPEEDIQTRKTAITGLLYLGSIAIPDIVQSYSDFLAEYPKNKKRLYLCHILGTSKDKRAINTLKKSVTDTDNAIRKCAEKYTKDK